MDPQWLAVNLAYLKDLDYLEQRQNASRSQASSSATPITPAAEKPAPRQRRRPKAKPNG